MTTTLIAKPIVENQLWVITDGVKKIGNVEADGAGYNVKIGGTVEHFASTTTIADIKHIEFQRPPHGSHEQLDYAVWPTDCKKTYNNAYDIKRRIHVFTKTEDSKCYYAAGWFNLNTEGEWVTELCPKYIFIQRYEYTGPYMTKQEAKQAK